MNIFGVIPELCIILISGQLQYSTTTLDLEIPDIAVFIVYGTVINGKENAFGAPPNSGKETQQNDLQGQ